MGRYVLPSMNLVTTIRHLLIGRLRWLIATGDERDTEILALRGWLLLSRNCGQCLVDEVSHGAADGA